MRFQAAAGCISPAELPVAAGLNHSRKDEAALATYRLEPERATLHGKFSRELPPVLTIESGDSVVYRTLDAAWGVGPRAHPGAERPKFSPLDPELDRGHCLTGPVAIRGARPGATLAVRINEVRPGTYGFTSAGGVPNWPHRQLGLDEKEQVALDWSLDPSTLTARSRFGNFPWGVRLRPFMGVMGMPPDEPGLHSTVPPRHCGGNIDCKELVPGSTLFLPVAVEGGLFSTGDGHAAMGDGECAGPALECPMERVDLTFTVLPDLRLSMPRADTPAGWITFGFHEDLNEAAAVALREMVALIGELYGASRQEALALASVAVDLHISQVVNGVKGVHAVLPPGAIHR